MTIVDTLRKFVNLCDAGDLEGASLLFRDTEKLKRHHFVSYVFGLRYATRPSETLISILTPYVHAAERIKCGCNTHQRMTMEACPKLLHTAVSCRDYDLVEEMLKGGANPNCDSYTEIAELLTDQNGSSGGYGLVRIEPGTNSPSLFAIMNKDPKMLLLLIRYGATIPASNNPVLTALKLAIEPVVKEHNLFDVVQFGHADVVELYLAKAVIPDHKYVHVISTGALNYEHIRRLRPFIVIKNGEERTPSSLFDIVHTAIRIEEEAKEYIGKFERFKLTWREEDDVWQDVIKTITS